MADLNFPSMFDTRQAISRQMQDDAHKAGVAGGGSKRYGMYYGASLGGDRYGQGLMGLAGMMGGEPDPRIGKQQALDEIMQRFPNPETPEDFIEIANGLQGIGLYTEANKAMEMANEIRSSMPTVAEDKLPTNIEEYNFAVDQGYDGSYMEFLAAKKAGTTVNVDTSDDSSVLWEAIDKSYAADYTNWMQNSGDMIAQVGQLETVLTKLEAGEDVTGAAKGLMPDWYNYLVNPQVIANKERVAEVVQRNLKLILGGQFSEREGEQLIARAYNPALDEKENIARLKRLILQMKAGISARQAMVEYVNQNGTLKGYTGVQPKISDYYAAMEGLQVGDRRGDWEYMGGDPGLQSSWKKITGAS